MKGNKLSNEDKLCKLYNNGKCKKYLCLCHEYKHCGRSSKKFISVDNYEINKNNILQNTYNDKLKYGFDLLNKNNN